MSNSYNPYKKKNSFQHMVAEMYLDGKSQDTVNAELRPKVQEQMDTRLIFNGHGPNGFGPLPINKQLAQMLARVDRTFKDMRGRGIEPRSKDNDYQDQRYQGKHDDGPGGNEGGDRSSEAEGGGQDSGEKDNAEGEGQESDGAEGDMSGESDSDAESEGSDGDGDSDGDEGDDGDEADGDDPASGEQGDPGDESDAEDEPKDGDESEADAESDSDSDSQQQQMGVPPAESDEWQYFVSEVKRLHKFCQERAEHGDWVDDFGMRPLIDGAKAFRNGVPAKALLHAMTIHWSPETRSEAEVKDFKPEKMDSRKAPPRDKDGNLLHPLSRYIYRLAISGLHIMLVGPKGAGKSHLARDVAALLEDNLGRPFPYGETPMTAGASPSWLIGGETMTGFKTRPFLEIYSGGGVFAFEEMDAADPNMTIVLNNALAAPSFYNPANGETYVKHPDFIAIGTANTFGLGANRDYTGRERLDGAFLDRFRMGRVVVDLDWNLGETIAGNIVNA